MTISITYAQFLLSDTEGDLDLTVSVEDEGAGKFFAIKTERWTFDSIAGLTAQLERIRSMFSDAEWDA